MQDKCAGTSAMVPVEGDHSFVSYLSTCWQSLLRAYLWLYTQLMHVS